MTTYTTFDPNNKQGVTLSGGNLIATNSSAADNGVKGVSLKTSGKLYFEMAFSALTGADSGGGVCGTGANFASLGADASRGALQFKNGAIYVNGVTNVNGGSISGQTLCVAVDLTNNKIWFRVNGGNWNNDVIGNQNPATNTGGKDISAITGNGLLILASVTAASETCTLNAGASAFAQTAPSGFSGWDNVTAESGVTDYGNTGGAGDRTASIPAISTTFTMSGTLNHLINGNLTEHDTFFSSGSAGQYLMFDFGVGASKVIDRFRWRQSNNTTHGSAWRWYGSNDNSTYTALGAGTFSLHGQSDNYPVEYYEPFGNTTGYRYYRLKLETGSTSSSPWTIEIDMHVGNAAVNSTATWASTEAPDVFAGAGGILGGSWGSTEAKDVFAGTGAQGSAIVGSLAATEAKDVFAGVAGLVGGSLGAVESPDLMSSIGYPALLAAWASTEAPDTFAFSGHNLALDGFAHNNSTTGSITTGNVTLTTADAHDVIVLCITTKGGAVTGISDVAGLTWARRTQFHPASTPTEDMEIWWAHAPTALTADVITITFSTTNGYAVEAFAVSGANTGAPFDTHNANSVTTDNAGSGNPSRTITTDFTGNQIIFGFLGSDDGGGDVSAISTGLTTFVNKCGGAPYAALGYATKATNQTALSCSFAQNGGTFNDRFLMVDAIVARVDIIGTLFTSDSKDSFSGAGYPQVIGTLGSTEAKDVWSGTGTVPPFGTVAAVEAKDVMGFAGEVGRPLGIDTSAAAVSHGSTTCNVAITTTVSDDIIVLGILSGGFFNHAAVGTVTDTAGLVWKRRHTRKQFGTNPIQEIWWAKKHSTGPTTITVTTLATTGFLCVDAIAISGARADAPWDTHSGAGFYNDNFGSGNPTGTIYSNSVRCMGLAFYGSNDVNNDGTVTAGWTYLDTLLSGETSGQTGRLDSAYQLFTAQQLGQTTVSFGQVGGGSNNRCIMQDVIVGANDVQPNAATADVIRWFFDGHGNQNIVAMSGTNNSLSQSLTTYNPDTTVLVAAMVRSGTGTRVLSVSDDGGHSGWERRSLVTDTVGTNSLELWWVNMAAPFTGNITVTLDSNVQPGDILGFIIVPINGPDLFLRGEIFDGHSSLPAVNHADAVSDPSVGPFSTLNENVLEIVIAANQSQDQRGFEAPGWLQFVGNFFGSESGILVSHSPLYNIALQAKFHGPVVTDDSTALAISPTPTTWMILADAMPVGPVSPPQGIWGSTDVKDRFGNSGAFTAIGIDTRGWVGFPPNAATMTAVETKDKTTNSGAFSAIWDQNGWIGYIPLFYSFALVDQKDVSSLHAWLLGPTTILAQMAATEDKDRMQFAALHTQYTTADSIGDRTSRITVTSNASFGGGTPATLVNGLKANNTTAACWVNIAQAAPMFFKFDFGNPRVINEAKWYQNGTNQQPGQWVWRGSNDNASWTVISAPFTLDAGNGGAAIGDISANQTAFRYYQLLQTTNAGGNDTPWLWEIEFKVEGIVGTIGAIEAKDRFAGNGLVIPTALPIPARKRRLLIVT